MFSPVGDSASLRNNPRRRRRNDGDTQRQPRKRSRIASDSFPPASNRHTNSTNGVNGHSLNGSLNTIGHGNRNANPTELILREKRAVSGSFKTSKDASSVWVRGFSHYMYLFTIV
jgi:hypothetical protein